MPDDKIVDARALFEKMRTADAGAWPKPLGDAAYSGLAGEMVRLIEPATESDSAGLLLQLLTAFGIHVGRTPHYTVEDTEHCGNLFVVLVGETSKARKGTAWGRIRGILKSLTEPPAIVSGLSSGEGLKYSVRDPVERIEIDKKSGEAMTRIADPGVSDKRLLVMEPEFASALRVMQRPGNTLSATAREAWDTGDLRTLTKHDPVVATGAHIGIIAHITVDELRAELTGTDVANGFGNRFLFACVSRSKELPFGGTIDQARMAELVQQFAYVAGTARTRATMKFDGPASVLWASKYSTLSAARPGLFGAVSARAEAQAVRLALLYALFDGAAEIDVAHLNAAFEVWRYCADSARCIFGNALGDRVADEILRALRAVGGEGMTRTEIRDLFARNASSDRIGAALALLLERGLVRRGTRSSGGRPTEIWVAVNTTKTT